MNKRSRRREYDAARWVLAGLPLREIRLHSDKKELKKHRGMMDFLQQQLRYRRENAILADLLEWRRL
jgi:hypothetical protein